MLYQEQAFDQVDIITQKFQQAFAPLLARQENFAQALEPEFIAQELPELEQQLTQRGWQLDISRVFVTVGQDRLPPHCDGNRRHPKFWALNWPVFNADCARMLWFEVQTGRTYAQMKSTKEYGDDIRIYNWDHCREIDSLVLKFPTCVRIDVPHAVVNDSADVRIVVSMRFQDSRHWR